MFSFYPQSYHQRSPYYQPSPYARALAQQQERQRALAQQQERQRALAQEMERQRAVRSRYFPDGYDYDYEPESDDEGYYLTPRQRTLLEARRRQEAVEQRNQEAARMRYEHSLKQQQARAAQSTSTTRTPDAAPVRVEGPSDAAPVRANKTMSPPPTPELLNEAVTKIQNQYRIHRSLIAISALASKFESLKASFVPPTTIDFQGGVSIPVSATSAQPPVQSEADTESAKLAFTPTNVPLHAYNEHLSRLLVALDAVESRCDRRVRERRREVIRAVEGEAARVEAFWRSLWAAYQQQQRDEQEVCAMVVDEESAVAPLPELAPPESDSESDVEPELPTPPATPAESPNIWKTPLGYRVL